MVVLLGRVGALPKAIGFLTGREAFAGAAYTFAGLFAAYLYFEVPRAVVTLESAFRRFPRRAGHGGARARRRAARAAGQGGAAGRRAGPALDAGGDVLGVDGIVRRRPDPVPPLHGGAAGDLHRDDRIPQRRHGRRALPGARPGDAGGGPAALRRGGVESGRGGRPRRAGIAAVALLALVLATPIAITAAGAFSHAEWYGERSEGAAVAGTPGALLLRARDLGARPAALGRGGGRGGAAGAADRRAGRLGVPAAAVPGRAAARIGRPGAARRAGGGARLRADPVGAGVPALLAAGRRAPGLHRAAGGEDGGQRRRDLRSPPRGRRPHASEPAAGRRRGG